MGKDVDAPQPVDPRAVAAADAEFNRINQFTPFGSLQFFQPGQPVPGISDTVSDISGTGGVLPGGTNFGPGANAQFLNSIGAFGGGGGRFTGGIPGGTGPTNASSLLTFSPEIQALFEQQLDVSGNALSEAQRRQAAISGGNLPDLITQIDPSIFEGTGADEVTAALFEQGQGLLDPIFQERERELTTRLANQGIPVGSEAFDFDFFQGLERERGRAFNDLGLSATIAGGQESRARRQQALGEFLSGANLAQTGRAQLLNELAQVLGQQQVATPGLQNFFAPGNVDVGGAFGLNAQQQQNAFQSQLGFNADIFGGLAGLGGSLGSAAIFASDRRLKKNLKLIQPAIYEWEWNDEAEKKGLADNPTTGFIAQDVQKWRPDAVIERDGVLMVNYGAL